MSINWSKVWQDFSEYFHIRRDHITSLRNCCLEDGHIFIFSGEDYKQGVEGAKTIVTLGHISYNEDNYCVCIWLTK